MRLVYLASTAPDFVWLRRYYAQIFPEGDRRAREQFRKATALLLVNPHIGRPVAPPAVRELVIPRTPFSIVYRVREDRIEILRIWDNRAERAPSGF